MGGGGANTAKSLARLGITTCFIDGISGDAHGQATRAELEASGVDLSRSLASDKPRALAEVSLATRHDWAGIWLSAGVVSSLQQGGSWLATAPREEWPEDLDVADVAAIWQEPWGDRRQVLVVIGAKLAPDLLARLDGCCLSDAEMALGPTGWLAFDDPFPAWRIVDDGDDTIVEDGEPD